MGLNCHLLHFHFFDLAYHLDVVPNARFDTPHASFIRLPTNSHSQLVACCRRSGGCFIIVSYPVIVIYDPQHQTSVLYHQKSCLGLTALKLKLATASLDKLRTLATVAVLRT